MLEQVILSNGYDEKTILKKNTPEPQLCLCLLRQGDFTGKQIKKDKAADCRARQGVE